MNSIEYGITPDEQMSFDMTVGAARLAKMAAVLDTDGRALMADGLRLEAEGNALFAKGVQQYTELKYSTGVATGSKKSLAQRLSEAYHMKAEGPRQTMKGKRMIKSGRKMLAEADRLTRESKKLIRQAKQIDRAIAAGIIPVLQPELPDNTLTD